MINIARQVAIASAALSVLALPNGAPAQTRQSLPAPVQAAQAEDAQSCRAMGGRATVKPGYAAQADFNGDGRTDYVLDQHHITCAAAPSLYCGSAGCGYLVFISRGSGFLPVVSVTGDEGQIRTANGKAVLHFANTGDPRGPTTWGWNGTAFARLARTSSPAPAAGAAGATGGWQALAFTALGKAEVARRYPAVRAANRDYNLDFESGQQDGWVNYPATSHVAAFEAKGAKFLVVSPQEAGCGSDCYAQVFADSGQGYRLVHRLQAWRPMHWIADAGALKVAVCAARQQGVRSRDTFAVWTVRDGALQRPKGPQGYFTFDGYASLDKAPPQCSRY